MQFALLTELAVLVHNVGHELGQLAVGGGLGQLNSPEQANKLRVVFGILVLHYLDEGR